ncbi:hypothetical protein [Nesterenkonia flava]|uniref:CobQ/CobB/MinD/ParA nucleotide binding domain-containing protein n=1 Tax=Nesterenkonia flava TaxID=469799 RepID=A0ABU1FQM9_9MICC|nr:hypothetical protein [Nesterenkonia flava]MDR5710949.1 hypothetical protein [Nesterenkonia flava]
MNVDKHSSPDGASEPASSPEAFPRFPGASTERQSAPTSGFPGATTATPETGGAQDASHKVPEQAAAPYAGTRHEAWTRPTTDTEGPADSQAKLFSRERRHGDYLAVRTWRTARRLVTADSFPERYAEAIRQCQQPVSTGRRLGIVSAGGGTGKSTVAAALSLLFAYARIDHIAALDLSDAPSGLNARMPAEGPELSLAEAAQHAARVGDPAESLRRVSASLSPALHRISAHRHEPSLDAEAIGSLYQLLSRTCAVSLVEIPSALVADCPQALSQLHAVCLATAPTSAGVEAAGTLLSFLDTEAPNVPVIPALVNAQRTAAADREIAAHEFSRALSGQGRKIKVQRIGADRHLATGGRISLQRIGEARRLQLAHLAGTLLSLATGHHTPAAAGSAADHAGNRA